MPEKKKARNKPNSNQVESIKSADKRRSTRQLEKSTAKQQKVEEDKNADKVTRKTKKVEPVEETEDEVDDVEEEEADEEADEIKEEKPKKSPIPRPKGSPFADALSPDLLEFLYELKQDNNRTFMRLHEKRWHKQRDEFRDFVKMLSEQLHEMDPTIMIEDPRQATYRQHRDLRFTNDLRPYKTYVSASFSRGGKKSPFAGYYIGVGPEGDTHVAGGIWQPAAPRLARIREGIIANGDLMREALGLAAIKETFGKDGISVLEDDDKLKVAPKNIPKDHPEIELLRYKSFVISKSFTDEQVVSAGFVDLVLDVFEALVPFITILNSWTG